MKTLTAEKAKELIEHLEKCTSINEGWYLQAMRIAYNVLKADIDCTWGKISGEACYCKNCHPEMQ